MGDPLGSIRYINDTGLKLNTNIDPSMVIPTILFICLQSPYRRPPGEYSLHKRYMAKIQPEDRLKHADSNHTISMSPKSL